MTASARTTASAANLASRRKLNRALVLFDATVRDELRVVAADEGVSLVELMVRISRAYVERWENRKGAVGTLLLDRVRATPSSRKRGSIRERT